MTLKELLESKKEQIVSEWLDVALSLYARDASVAYGKKNDQFANPVGHSLREGTLGIFEALQNDGDAAKIRQHLGEIVKIRAVQQFPASATLDFVFRLKDVIRNALGEKIFERQISSELPLLERKIDEAAAVGFDVYVECREKVFEIRTSEMKRSVSWVVEKLNKRDGGSDEVGAEQECESPTA